MRRRRLLLIGSVAVLVVALVAILVATRGRSPVEHAQRLVKDPTAFETGLGSGETLARVAQHLGTAVESCRRDAPGIACQSLSSALGYAQVLASMVLTCTDPGREDARTRMLTYLDEVADVGPEATRVPEPPRLPDCT